MGEHPPAQLLDQLLGVLVRRAVHALRHNPAILVVGEEPPAVEGLAVVLLVPLHKVHARPAQRPAVLELDQAEQEEGHVQIEHPEVLVQAVRQPAPRLGDLAPLDQRGDGRDFEEEPALLHVQPAHRGPHGRPGDGRGEPIPRRRLERQALVQVVGHVRGVAVRIVHGRARHGHGGRVDDRPDPVRLVQRRLVRVRGVLVYRALLDHGRVGVPLPDRLVAQEIPDVRLLRHDHVAAHAGRHRGPQVVSDRDGLLKVGRGSQVYAQRAQVQALILSRPGPHRRLRTLEILGRRRLEVEERRVELAGGNQRVVRGHESDPHVLVVIVQVAHVLDRDAVVRIVKEMRQVLLGRELGALVQLGDLGGPAVLVVQEHHGQHARAVEQLDLAHIGEERDAAREAQPALVRHALSIIPPAF
jgi:hypothetical protein